MRNHKKLLSIAFLGMVGAVAMFASHPDMGASHSATDAAATTAYTICYVHPNGVTDACLSESAGDFASVNPGESIDHAEIGGHWTAVKVFHLSK